MSVIVIRHHETEDGFIQVLSTAFEVYVQEYTYTYYDSNPVLESSEIFGDEPAAIIVFNEKVCNTGGKQ